MSLFVFFEVERQREGTTVWLLHEGLEKEGISPGRHCRQAEWETWAWEWGAQLAAHPAQPCTAICHNRHSLDRPGAPMGGGEGYADSSKLLVIYLAELSE